MKSKQENGSLVSSTRDQRCVMTLLIVTEARLKPLSTAVRMGKEIYNFNKTGSRWCFERNTEYRIVFKLITNREMIK